MIRRPPRSTLFPNTTLSRSESAVTCAANGVDLRDPLKPAEPADSQTMTFPSRSVSRSEEHTSELQSRQYLVCRLLLEKKKKHYIRYITSVSLGYCTSDNYIQ